MPDASPLRLSSLLERGARLQPDNLLVEKTATGYSTTTYAAHAVASRALALALGESGITIGDREGSPVRAAADGRVVYRGSGLTGYGNLLIVKHNDRWLSAYAHNSSLLVKEGDRVSAGDKIATMGASGTFRTQLHFEIRKDGQPVDPLTVLPNRS